MRTTQLYSELVQRISEARDGVYLAPLFISGPPGIGKSRIAQTAAKDTKVPFYDNRLTLFDPTDVRGYPVPDHTNKTVEWWLPKTLPTQGPGLVAFEELNSAPPLVQAATYQLFLDRKLGDYTVPDGVVLIALGNRAEDRAVTFRMPSALANRFVHVELDSPPNPEDWFYWAMENKIEARVVAYIKAQPHRLFNFDPATSKMAFATPRSWEYVSDILKAKRDSGVERELVGGAIGPVSTEFYAWLKVYDRIPDMQRIFKGEDLIPDKTDELYALCVALVYAAKPEQYERLLKYGMAFPPERVEFVTLMGKVMQTMNSKAMFNGSTTSKEWSRRFLHLMGKK